MTRHPNKIHFTSGIGINIALLLSSLLISVLSTEIGLRFLGYQPWIINEVKTVVEPGGKFFVKHPTLGYTHLPGTFRVTLQDGYSFKVTHLDNTLRVTHPLESYDFKRQKDEFWIFGDSITHGWSLNDKETYPWLLQENLPEYEIVNFGVSGYGTLHSFLQFQDALKTQKKPKLVVVAYASFHDRRNTFLRERRKRVAPHNKLGPLVQPYARIDTDGNLTYYMAEVEYNEIPLMRYSALVHLFEEIYNETEDRLYNSHEVSQAILKEFYRLAQENGVEFVVAGIASDPLTSDMLAYCRGEGITTIDISIDLDIPGNRNLPHDPHPSATANKQYAQKLEAFLRDTFLRGD
jgi:hypothetical protein